MVIFSLTFCKIWCSKGFVAEFQHVNQEMNALSLQGNLVMLPLDFLSEENLQPPTLAKEGIVPTVTWTSTNRQQARDYGYHR